MQCNFNNRTRNETEMQAFDSSPRKKNSKICEHIYTYIGEIKSYKERSDDASVNNLISKIIPLIALLQNSSEFNAFEKKNPEIKNRINAKTQEIRVCKVDLDNNSHNGIDSLLEEMNGLIDLMWVGIDREVVKKEDDKIYNNIRSKIKIICDCKEDLNKAKGIDNLIKEISRLIGCFKEDETLFFKIEDEKIKRFATKDLIEAYINTRALERAENFINLLKDTISDDPNSELDSLKIDAQIELAEALIKSGELKNAENIAIYIKDLAKAAEIQLKVLKAYVHMDMLKEVEDFIPKMQISKRFLSQRLLVEVHLDDQRYEDAERIALAIEDRELATVVDKILNAYEDAGMLKEADDFKNKLLSIQQN